MIRSALILLLLFIAVNTFAQGSDIKLETTGTEIKSPKQFGSEYMPLNTDKEYIFETSLGEATSFVEEEDEKLILVFENSFATYKQELIKKEDGIYLTGTANEVVFSGSSITYSSPVLRIPFPLEIGKEWKWEGYEYYKDDSSRVTFEGIVQAEEKVETESGTFECLKIGLKISKPGRTPNLITEWLAPNIGVVKSSTSMSDKGFTGLVKSVLGIDNFEMLLLEID